MIAIKFRFYHTHLLLIKSSVCHVSKVFYQVIAFIPTISKHTPRVSATILITQSLHRFKTQINAN